MEIPVVHLIDIAVNDQIPQISGLTVQTVKEFLKKQTSVKKVIFNVFKDLDKAIYEKLLRAD